MKASELLIRCLEHEDVHFIFGVPGEENLDVMDALRDSSIRFVTTRHEQGAAFMADVHGRLSGKAGVCLSTLGPGATNLITGVADANMDHAPLVAISGQASLDRKHIESHQYIDLPALFKPVTKWNTEIALPRMIPETVRKAFKVAQTEKPGATHLVLPEDVAAQESAGLADMTPLKVQAPFVPEPQPAQIQRALAVLKDAERPMMLVGNGVARRHAEEAVRTCAETLQIPVLHTFMGKGIMPDSHALSLYTIGMPVRDYAAAVMEKADVVIAVGYDLVEYAPCFWNPNKEKRIIHVDVSPAEVDAHYQVEVGILGDVAQSLEALTKAFVPFSAGWSVRARETVFNGLEKEHALPPTWPLRPQQVVRDLRRALAPEDIVICDVGAHKLWMARMFPCEEPNTCLISNGFASMGMALPGAVAAQLLYPSRRVVVVTGDGGFLMNSPELETLVRLQLPVVILIWRDNGYGVIRWKQMREFGRTSSVDFGNPDFATFAKAFGADGLKIEGPSELLPALTQALGSGRPTIIDCPVDYEENLRLSDYLTQIP
jgi:acetolactate synthase I/II/III large subunit